jgi:hypothetical protein
MGKIAMHFGEVVLKTSQYDALKSWYSQVLDAKPMFESERREQPAPVGMRQMCLIRPYSDFPFTETLVILDVLGLRQVTVPVWVKSPTVIDGIRPEKSGSH